MATIISGLYGTSVPALRLIHQGKTRDTYELPGYPALMLVVATDRLSTHNVVHESAIAQKGEVLTALTIFWMLTILGPAGIDTHIHATGTDIYTYMPADRMYPPDLHHRAIVVRRLRMNPVEFIWRQYLCGSLWKEFYSRGINDPYGLNLPKGLSLMHAFGQALFTPTEKSETDPPLPGAATTRAYPRATSLSEEVFVLLRKHLSGAGIELVDMKCEIGEDEAHRCVLADEFGTPDCCRFTELAQVRVGSEPVWLDKQRARDEAERIWRGGTKVPLRFDEWVEHDLSETYRTVFERITGMPLAHFQKKYLDA